jgi:hypothetical protein
MKEKRTKTASDSQIIAMAGLKTSRGLVPGSRIFDNLIVAATTEVERITLKLFEAL